MSIDTKALSMTAERGGITVCQQTDAPPQVIDFETLATMRGASRLDYCEDGVVSPAGHMPKANWRRVMQARAERNADLAQRRSELWEEYQRLVAEGKVRPPSRIEKLLVIANGHEDRAQTHAARRVLAKRGIDWMTDRYGGPHMRDTFVCDLCHARVKETRWEHQAAGLYLNVYLPCRNPMGAVSTNGNWQRSEIEYDEVCNDCREAVAAQIAAAVKSRLALAKRRRNGEMSDD